MTMPRPVVRAAFYVAFLAHGVCGPGLVGTAAAQPEPAPAKPPPGAEPVVDPYASPVVDPYGQEPPGATGAAPGERPDEAGTGYDVKEPDPWAGRPEPAPQVEAERQRGTPAYEHRDSLEPWPATAGERRRARQARRQRERAIRQRRTPAARRAWVGYDDGFFLRTPDNRHRLQFNSRLEARYLYRGAGEDDVRSAFLIPRARFILSGHVFMPELSFRLEPGFGGGDASLKEAYLDYAFVPDALHLRAGQTKRPLSRQQINRSDTFQFLERAITSGRLGAARDIGLLFHNDYEGSPTFEYAVGIFNGTGDISRLAGRVLVDPITHEGIVVDGGFSNVPSRFQPEATARVAYNHGDIDGYSEVDFDGGPLRFSVGASALAAFGAVEPDVRTDPGSGSVLSHLDAMLKAYGITATAGAFLLHTQDGPSFTDQAYASTGFHLQAGYLMFRRAQLAARYARVHYHEEGATHEAGGALSLYFIRTNLAWRTDALFLVDDFPPAYRNQFVVRSQVQLGF